MLCNKNYVGLYFMEEKFARMFNNFSKKTSIIIGLNKKQSKTKGKFL